MNIPVTPLQATPGWVSRAGPTMKRFSPNDLRGTTSRTLLIMNTPEAVVTEQSTPAQSKLSGSPVMT